MSLAISLNATASELILRYGNTSTLTSNVVSGGYNPQTGEFSINTSTDIVIKAVSVNTTIEAMKVAGIDESSYGYVKKIYTIPYSDEYATIDSSWKVDGYSINKIIEKKAQDVIITLQLFVG